MTGRCGAIELDFDKAHLIKVVKEALQEGLEYVNKAGVDLIPYDTGYLHSSFTVYDDSEGNEVTMVGEWRGYAGDRLAGEPTGDPSFNYGLYQFKHHGEKAYWSEDMLSSYSGNAERVIEEYIKSNL